MGQSSLGAEPGLAAAGEEPGCRSRGDAEGNLLTVPCQVGLAPPGPRRRPAAVSSQVRSVLPVAVSPRPVHPAWGWVVTPRAEMWRARGCYEPGVIRPAARRGAESGSWTGEGVGRDCLLQAFLDLGLGGVGVEETAPHSLAMPAACQPGPKERWKEPRTREGRGLVDHLHWVGGRVGRRQPPPLPARQPGGVASLDHPHPGIPQGCAAHSLGWAGRGVRFPRSRLHRYEL